jgi:hypothetical protein
MAYSFRFYGRAPFDWLEGGNLGHAFDVQFQRVPSEAEREQLAELWYAATATGIVEPGPWRWSERFAVFLAGERWISRGGHIGVVTDFLMEARRVVPIVDAVYYNAREGGGAWDHWSLQQGPPDPGPAFGRAGMAAYQRAVDPGLPAPAADPVFDAAFGRCVAVRAAQQVADAIATPPKPGQVGLEPVAEPRRPDGPSDLARFRVPEPPYVKDARGHGQYADGDHPAHSIRQRAIAWVKHAGAPMLGGLAWFEGDERRELPIRGGGAGLSVSADGNEALFRQSDTAWHVDLRTGTSRTWYRKEREDGYELVGTAWANGGRWAVLATKRLQVFAPGEAPRQLAVGAVSDAASLHAARDGQILIINHYKNVTTVFASLRDELKKVGTFTAGIAFAFETEGGIYLRQGDRFYALTRVDEALERIAPRKPKTRPNKVEVRLGAVREAPPRPEIPAELTDKLGPARISVGASGRVVAVPLIQQHGMTHAWGLKVVGDDGAVVDHTSKVLEVAGGKAVDFVAISATGDRVAAIVASTVVCLDVASGQLALVVRNVRTDHGGLRAVAFASETELLVLAEKSLRHLRQVPGAAWDELAALKLSNARTMAVGSVASIAVAAIVTTGSKPLCVVAAPPSGKLKKLGELRDPLQSVAWEGESLVTFDKQGRWWSVDGIREGVAAIR